MLCVISSKFSTGPKFRKKLKAQELFTLFGWPQLFQEQTRKIQPVCSSQTACFSWVSCQQITYKNYLNCISNVYRISNYFPLKSIEINSTALQIELDGYKHFWTQYLNNLTLNLINDLLISTFGLPENYEKSQNFL